MLYRSADVMVESMACGTPVAARPVAARPVVGPIDVVGLAGGGGVLDVDLRRACLSAQACDRVAVRRWAQRHTWSAATEQFVRALRPIRR